MNGALVRVAVRVRQAITVRGEAGQGSLEYIGAVLVAAAVVIVVLAGFAGVDIGDAVQSAVDKVINGGSE